MLTCKETHHRTKPGSQTSLHWRHRAKRAAQTLSSGAARLFVVEAEWQSDCKVAVRVSVQKKVYTAPGQRSRVSKAFYSTQTLINLIIVTSTVNITAGANSSCLANVSLSAWQYFPRSRASSVWSFTFNIQPESNTIITLSLGIWTLRHSSERLLAFAIFTWQLTTCCIKI